MAPKGRSAPRAGVRKFGGQGGKWKGQKRPHRFNKGPRFDAARLADEEDLENEKSERASGGVEDHLDLSDQEGSGSDEESKARPYMKLIQSFTHASDAPKAKRRKLDHGDGPQAAAGGDHSAADEQDGLEDVDAVEEPEEEIDLAPTEGYLDDEDDEPDTSDPFERHFSNPDEQLVLRKVKAVEKDEWATKKVASKGSRTVITVPQLGDDTKASLPAPISGPAELNLKRRLEEIMEKKRPNFDATEQSLAPLVFGYGDVLYCNRTVDNGEDVRRLACLHALNHVYKTRDRVIKDNAKLAHESGNAELELRDQGYTRPKVLMLLPTRQSCARMVDMLCSICEPDQQENRKRFEDSYVDKQERFSKDKPADFRDLFEGNDGDMFRLGMKFTRKTIKYFAQFYNSDIIFASPLGLRMAIGSEEDKKPDYDFLSSIEVVIVDQADALLMQNWEHVEFIFEHLNLQPTDAHGCDFSRVRNWYLDGQSKFFRQTLMFSAFNSPELSEVFRLYCHNWAGKYRVHPEYPGVIQQLGLRARQTFSRFESPSVEADPDARFEYFTKAIVPTLAKRSKDSAGTLVFIPSYFDFVRVRNYFATNSSVAGLTFGTISEYADVPEVSRARSHFMNGRHKVLLYTERAHHFRRHNLNGVQRVIMYGLPDNPVFYREIAGGYLAKSEQNSTIEPGRGSVRVMFSKYDVLKLERVVGSQRVGKMIHERGDTFDFV